MFDNRNRDLDAGHRSLPGFMIWEAVELIAFTQTALHRRFNKIGEDQDSQDYAASVGLLRCAHWDDFVQDYNSTGYAGFCKLCTNNSCIINRNHACRILALYNLVIKLFPHYGSDLYVTDLGISREDINKFIYIYTLPRPGMNRFVRNTQQTVPGFRNYSTAVYSGNTIDITKLDRPIL